MRLTARTALQTSALALALVGGAAQAVPGIWRCADNSYAQQPCPEGRLLETLPAPSPEQQREARELAERDKRLAGAMQQERLEREHAWRQAHGSGLVAIGGTQGSAAAALSPPSARKPPRGQPRQAPAQARALKKAPPEDPRVRVARAPKAP